MPSEYPIEFRQRALGLLQEKVPDAWSGFAAINRFASKLGISIETLRRWNLGAKVDAGQTPGMATGEREEVRTFKRENAE